MFPAAIEHLLHLRYFVKRAPRNNNRHCAAADARGYIRPPPKTIHRRVHCCRVPGLQRLQGRAGPADQDCKASPPPALRARFALSAKPKEPPQIPLLQSARARERYGSAQTVDVPHWLPQKAEYACGQATPQLSHTLRRQAAFWHNPFRRDRDRGIADTPALHY